MSRARTGRRPQRLLVSTLTAVAVLAACATTIDERGSTSPSASHSATAPLTVPSGTDEDLLAQLLTAMTGLSTLIGPAVGPTTRDGTDRPDKQQRLVEIEAIWAAARPKVEAVDARVARQIDRLVAMSREAVERNRPADADKAARFLSDVIAAYLADAA